MALVCAGGNTTVPCLWPVTDVFQLQMHWAENAVVYCACDIIQLFSAVFCMIRAVYKFYFRLVIDKKETTSCCDGDFFDRIYMFFPDRRRHAVLVNCILLSKELYVSHVKGVPTECGRKFT
jgi:hypothetical protein